MRAPAATAQALTHILLGEGVTVVEVNRPSRAARRRDGKSDRLDSEQAARAVLAGNATATPKTRSAKTALRDLALRWSALDAEAKRLKRQLTALISRVAAVA